MKHRIILMASALTLACGSNLILPTQSLASNSKQANDITFQQKYSLDEIINLALDSSPSLKAQKAETLASEGEYNQARTYTNPELSVEAEDFEGSGSYKGYDSAQTTYGLSQKIAVGGKYSAKVKAAEYGYSISSGKQEVARLELIKDVKVSYAEAVAAQKNFEIAKEQKNLAEQFLSNVIKRVNAAAEPVFQRTKAEVALSTATIILGKSQEDMRIAKTNLALLWGSNDTNFDLSDSDFIRAEKFEIDQEVLSEIIKNSHYARILQNSEAQAKELYNFERANAIPDPTLNFGYRELSQSDDNALVAGLSIPIPVFDQNRGNIDRARSQANKIRELNRSSLLEIQNQLLASYNKVKISYGQILMFKDKILPSAEKAFQQTKGGYNAGKFPYLEVIDSLRTLSDAKFSYNNSLKEYHIRRAEIERFVNNQIKN